MSRETVGNNPKIYLDSCILIYLFEGTPEQRTVLKNRLFPAKGTGPLLCYSDLVRLECRVRPIKNKEHNLLSCYDAFFRGSCLVYIPLTPSVFDHAAELRAGYALKTPDAIHLAAAGFGGCSIFLTNDQRLGRIDFGFAIEQISADDAPIAQ